MEDRRQTEFLLGEERFDSGLGLEDNSEGLILNLRNFYYLPNSPCNLVSLGLLNDSGIYHDNEHETLYQVKSKKVLAQARRWRNSYLLKPLNLSDGAVRLLKTSDGDYQWPAHALQSVSLSSTLPLSTWHKRLGHSNFSSLKSYLNRLDIAYVDDSDGYICDSCLHSDSDWAGDKESRKSTSGFIFKLNGGLVSWYSKKQPAVALSSTEAEYIALTLAVKEATWLRLLLTELGLLQPDQQHGLIKVSEHNTCAQAIQSPDIARGGENESRTSTIIIPLKGDNQGSIALAHNPVFHSRTKHIDIQHNYIRDEVVSKRIKISYVPTDQMIADGLTKALTHIKFHGFIHQMRMT